MPDPAAATIRLDMPVAEVMRCWPDTMAVFLDRKMACPGCPMASFMNVAEAASSYGLDGGQLVDDLRDAASTSQTGS